MNKAVAQALQCVLALSRDERIELAGALLATLDVADDSVEARYAALRAAVDKGIASLDAGKSTLVPAGELRGFIHGLGREAAERVARKQR